MFMQKLRKNVTFFLWFLAGVFILFIFFNFGSNVIKPESKVQQGYIARVDKNYITMEEYNKRYNDYIKIHYGMRSVIDPREMRQVSDKVIDNLIVDQILNGIRKERKIVVYPKTIASLVKNMPPPQVLRDTTFWKNGKFDIQKYQSLISDPRNRQFVITYENQLIDEIPKRILNDEILSLVRMTRDEVYRELIEKEAKIKIAYLFFPIKLARDYNPTEKEITEYYNAHQDEFRDNYVDLSYVVFKINILGDDKQAARDNAANVISQYKAGIPFDSLAAIYSEDDYAAKGGEMGWVSLKNLKGEFLRVIKKMKVGSISEPIEGKNGLTILKLEGRKGDKVKLREIFIKYKPSQESYANAKKEAEEFIKSYKKDSLNTLKVYKLFPKVLRYKEGMPNPMNVDFSFLLRNVKKGDFLPPIIGDEGFFVFWVKDVKKGVAPLNEIKEMVIAAIRREKGKTETLKEAMGLRMKIKKDLAPFKNVAMYRVTDYFSLRQTVAGISYRNEVYGAAFRLPVGVVSNPIATDRGVYIIKVLDRKKPDTKTIQDKLNAISKELYNKKRSIFLNEWYKDNLDRHRIDDYRYELSL